MLALSLLSSGRAQTLAQALEQAWERQPGAVARRARSAEVDARKEAAARLTPGAASVSVSQLNDRVGSNRGRQEWEAEVSTPLWLPGQRAAREAEAEALGTELSARSLAQKWELAGELREAWWTLAAARQALDLATRRSSTAEALADDVGRRYRAGDLARVDANLAQSELLAAEAERLEAELGVQQSAQLWLRLTGTAAPLQLAAEAPYEANAPMPDHPRLAAGNAAVRLARARLALAEGFAREAPELALRASRERADGGEPFSNSIGVRLTVPLSFGPRVRVERSAAQAEVDEAEATLARTRDRIAIDFERAQLELRTAERHVSAARERGRLAADNLRLMEKSFSLGEIDLATLLRMRAAWYDVEALQRRQQLARSSALSRLRQAAGEMP